MKRFLFVTALVMAQGMALGAGMPTPTAPKVLPSTPMNRLTIRLRQQNIQIQREVKVGKLTAAQAKTLKDQVGAIRKAEIADLKQNNSKTLTDAQMAQLNDQLNTLSKSIPIRWIFPAVLPAPKRHPEYPRFFSAVEAVVFPHGRSVARVGCPSF